MRYLRILFCLTLALMLGGSMSAQFDTGSILGTVKDASGAVVPDATVTVTNTATGVVTTRNTNGTGDFEVPGLRAGSYDVSIGKAGFASSLAKGVAVSIGARQRVDLSLNAGAESQTVDVTSVAPLVETDTSQRGQVITGYTTASIPLVSRNYSDLLATVTGVHQAPNYLSTTATSGLVREGGYNVNGHSSVFNNFLLDGMDNNAYGSSNQGFSNQIFNPPPDSIAQFQVVTNNQSAEFGRAAGATFNVAYKSGTNKFHGLVYEFIRNTKLNAVGYFHATPAVKPQFIRNQFGGNFQGPIMHDKMFFFLDYEGFRQVRKLVTTVTLPTTNQRNRIFSKTVYDPYTGTAYAAGVPIPSNAPNISPTALAVLAALPPVSNGNATSNYSTLQRANNFSDKGSLRLDYTLNAKNSFFLRVSDLKQNATDFPLFPLPIDGSTNGKQRILDQQIALGWNHQIGNSAFLDARLGLSRTKAGKFSLSIGQPGFTFAGLPTDPAVAGGLPSTSISGFTALGRQSTNPQFQNPALMNPKVNFAWVRGKHSLKVGYEYQHVWMAVQDTNPLYGAWTFNGAFSRAYANGAPVSTDGASPDNYIADYLFGAPNSYSISSYFVAHVRNQSHFAYMQDDWKVTPHLTLNLGVRYEYGTPYYEQKNQQTNFNPALSNSATPTSAMVPVSSTGNKYGYDPDRNDWAPRVGFAYSPNEKMSVRGGYGISYVHYSRAGSGDLLALNAPQALFITTAQAPVRANGNGTYRTMDSGFPASLTFNPITANVSYIDSKTFRDTYVHSYFMSVQQQLWRNSLLDVAYVGNHSVKLPQFANINQVPVVNGQLAVTGSGSSVTKVRPYQNYGDITYAFHQGYGNYNSLQARFEQRMLAGLTLLNSFTWSKTLDNAGSSLESNTPSPQDFYNLRGDYSYSDYDQPFVNTTTVVYELPFGRGRKWLNQGGIVNQVLGGWQLSGINQSQSGAVFNITYAPTSTNQVSGLTNSFRGSNIYRPNRVPGVPLLSLRKSAATTTTSVPYTNLAALALPASGTGAAPLSPFGTLPRNAGRTPSINYLNLALNKKFLLPREGMFVEFRSEAYNVFNHTNFAGAGAPSGTIGSAYTSTAPYGNTPTGGGLITATYDARIFQFGLKVAF